MKSKMFDLNARSNPPYQHSSSGNTSIKFKQQLNIDGNAGTRLRWDILPHDIKRQQLNIDGNAGTRLRWDILPHDIKRVNDVHSFVGLISKNEQPALLNEVINLWLSVEVYRVKLWKDIQNAPEHYMAKLNQVLDPLLTSKDAPELVKVPVQLLLIFAKLFSSSKKTEPKNVSLDQLIGMDTAISQMRKVKALDDVIYMGRRLDDFTKNVKVGGAGKKPIILSAYDIINISVEKWTVKLIGGVGKSITIGLKNTTNGRKKGLKLRVKVVADSEQNTITGSNHELGRVNSNSLSS
ncbi:hypothetical protein Tco_0167697 [Tanacetum coccineum]